MGKIIAEVIDKKKYFEMTGVKPKGKTVKLSIDEAEILTTDGVVKLSDLTLKALELSKKKQKKTTILEESDDPWRKKKAEVSKQYQVNSIPEFPWNFSNESIDLHISSGVEHKTSIELMTPWFNEDDNAWGITFFDEPKPRGVKSKTAEARIVDFFEYRADWNGLNLMIYSRELIEESFVNIEGILTRMSDEKKVGDKTALRTRKWLFIACKVSTPKVSKEKIEKSLEINDIEELRKTYFGLLRQPTWFENLILAWNICSNKRYPIHILAGDMETENEHQGGFGKSDLFDRIQLVNGKVSSSGEPDVFDVSHSTPKGLVPSFKGERIDPGYLLSSPTTACVDEFYAIFDSLDRESKIRELTEHLTALLEHRKRLAKSGNTPSSRINPTFRVFIAGNLPSGITDLSSLTQKLHPPMVERMIPYFYNEEHRRFIEANRERVNKEMDKGAHEAISTDISAWLYYSTKTSLKLTPEIEKKMDAMLNEIREITKPKDIIPILKGKKEGSFFEKRFPHHVRALFDGVVKIQNLPSFQIHLSNCIEAGVFEEWVFEPTNEDYSMVVSIMEEVIRSWV